MTQAVRSFKMPFKSRLFNKNQRVWVIFGTGDDAAFCYGRHRGRGRYIRAWVKWDTASRPAPVIQEFDVDDVFARRIMGQVQ